jgi:hypothetical protein
MDTFLAVCGALALMAVTAVAVYLIVVLVQVKKTAQSAEVLLNNLNEETAKLQKVTGAVSEAAEFVSGVVGHGAASTLGMAGAFLRGFFGKSGKNGEKDEEESESPRRKGSGEES